MLRKLKKIFLSLRTPPNYYHILGKQEGISILVEKFYQEMETNPAAINCLKTHQLIEGHVPDSIKEKLKEFITGWLGGPNLFVEKYGHPRMKMRHMRIKVGEQERDQWLLCMNTALKDHPNKIKTKYKIALANSFAALAIRIQNS